MVISKAKRPIRARRVRVYVRAWRVRTDHIPQGNDIPQGTAPAETRPRALSITAPSGGAGAQRLSGATVSEASTHVEEARRRRLLSKQFYITETVRGRERWRSGPLASRTEARHALMARTQIYTAQGCQAKPSRDCRTVRFAGVTIDIRIVRDGKAVAA